MCSQSFQIAFLGPRLHLALDNVGQRPRQRIRQRFWGNRSCSEFPGAIPRRALVATCQQPESGHEQSRDNTEQQLAKRTSWTAAQREAALDHLYGALGIHRNMGI